MFAPGAMPRANASHSIMMHSMFETLKSASCILMAQDVLFRQSHCALIRSSNDAEAFA